MRTSTKVLKHLGLVGVKMNFKDAAFQILTETGDFLHYSHICDLALERGILETHGQTPQASMGALLYTDTLHPNSRFRRGEVPGTFGIKTLQAIGIQNQVELLNRKTKATLLQLIHTMDPRKFESLIQTLLDDMGLLETTVTPYRGDGGIDVRGILNVENFSKISVAVQAKRWVVNVGPSVVRELRGSIQQHERGIIITPSNFTESAIREASAIGMSHISLINGSDLVELLIQNQTGVINQPIVINTIDSEFWSEIFGEEIVGVFNPRIENRTNRQVLEVVFPLQVKANFRGQTYYGLMENREGRLSYNGRTYATVSAAAKVIANDWHSVNGWKFWRFQDTATGRWHYISIIQ